MKRTKMSGGLVSRGALALAAVVAVLLTGCNLETQSDKTQRLIRQGKALLKTDDAAEALAKFEEAVRHEPSSRNAHYYAGVAHIELEQWDEALAGIGNAVRLDPELEEGHIRLLEVAAKGWRAPDVVAYLENLKLEHGEVALVAKTLSEARETVRKQEEARAQAEELRLQALTPFELRRWKEAFDLLKRAEALCPLLPDVPLHIGICLYRMHYYLDAIARLKPYVEANLDDNTANQYLGWSYIRAAGSDDKSWIEEGCAFYEKLVSSHPDEDHAFLHMAVGTMYFARGAAFREKAVAEWTIAAEQDKTYARPHVNLGWDHYENRRYDQALAEFRTALDLGAEEFRTYMGAAATHLAMGRLDSAHYLYRRACQLDLDDAEARWLLGTVRHKLGSRAGGAQQKDLYRRALADYKQVLQISPHPVFVKRSEVDGRIAALERSLAPPPPRRTRPHTRPMAASRPPAPGTPSPTTRPMFMMVAPEEGEH